MKPEHATLCAAAALAAALFFAAPAATQSSAELVSGPGVGLTREKCRICHDLGHITRSQLSREQWVDNLRMMRERGAQFSDEEARIMLDYLATYYGREPPPPPAPDTLAAGAGGDLVAGLLQAHACTGCHTLDKRVVGPSFREIAERYGGDGGAAAQLAQKVRQGSQGVWGQVPMPPTAGISDGDLAAIVQWVLAQK